jgi:hypothetical protein
MGHVGYRVVAGRGLHLCLGCGRFRKCFHVSFLERVISHIVRGPLWLSLTSRITRIYGMRMYSSSIGT